MSHCKSKTESLPYVGLSLQDSKGKATIAAGMFKISEEDKLIAENVLDSEGKLCLYDATVQKCIFSAIKTELVKELKAQAKAKEECIAQERKIENVARVARKLAESADSD